MRTQRHRGDIIAQPPEHRDGRKDAARSPRILYWRETTDLQPFETGIQRVTRRLADGLTRRGLDLLPVGWDPMRRLMRALVPTSAGIEAGADWLLLPEIPATLLDEGLDPIQLAHAYGLRSAAIVHDLIPVRLAHLYGTPERALFRRYFHAFAQADLVLATTGLVAGHLREYLAAEGLRVPEILVVPLPAQFAARPRVRRPLPREPGAPLRLLTVATWEPRKNLTGLLRTLRRARERGGPSVDVTLVGRRGAYPDYDVEIDALLAELPGCSALPRADDAELAALYAAHHAGLYPSPEEGFGMPVLESLWLGRPCLCHAGSAMAEVAPGGGTLMLDMRDEAALADGLVRAAQEPGLLDRLSSEALARPLRDWTDYAADVAERLEGAPGSRA